MALIADLGTLLGSPAWTAGATILAAIGLGLTIYLYRKSKFRKRLTYWVSIIELVSVHGDAKDEIQISYGGEVVERVHLIEISLKNTGNVPIPGSDYEVPFSVVLGEGSKVLRAEVAKVNPAELSPTVEVANEPNRPSAAVEEPEAGEDVITKVKLAPMLLNAGDRLSIKILVSDFAGDPDLDYRIVGVSRLINGADPKQRTWKQKWGDNWPALGLGIAFLALSFTIGLKISDPDRSHSEVRMLGGKTRCAKILETSSQQLIIQEEGSGRIFKIPINQVISVKDNSC